MHDAFVLSMLFPFIQIFSGAQSPIHYDRLISLMYTSRIRIDGHAHSTNKTPRVHTHRAVGGDVGDCYLGGDQRRFVSRDHGTRAQIDDRIRHGECYQKNRSLPQQNRPLSRGERTAVGCGDAVFVFASGQKYHSLRRQRRPTSRVCDRRALPVWPPVVCARIDQIRASRGDASQRVGGWLVCDDESSGYVVGFGVGRR